MPTCRWGRASSPRVMTRPGRSTTAGVSVAPTGGSRQAACLPCRTPHRIAPALHRGDRSRHPAPHPGSAGTSATAALPLLPGDGGQSPVLDPYPEKVHVQNHEETASPHAAQRRRPRRRQGPGPLPHPSPAAASPAVPPGRTHLGGAARPSLNGPGRGVRPPRRRDAFPQRRFSLPGPVRLAT